MTNKSSNIIVKVFTLIQSIALVAVALLLIISCVGIYRSGNEPPFSRSTVIQALLDIAAPMAIFLIITLAGFIGSIFIKKEVKIKEYGSFKKKLTSLKRRFDFSEIPDCRIIAMEKSRKIIYASSCVISALSLLLSLIYILFFAKLTVKDLNADIISLFCVILPPIIASLILAIAALYVCEYSMKLEISYITETLKTNKNIKKLPPVNTLPNAVSKSKAVLYTRIAVLALAVIFIVLGVFNSGMNDVFAKAVQICTECIGLG